MNHYKLCFKLPGHNGAVLCLAVRDDGTELASGGTDGTMVWSTTNQGQLAVPGFAQMRGATTAVLWIKREDDLAEALVFGTQGGFFSCWRKLGAGGAYVETWNLHLAGHQEITGLAFDPTANRLAVCNRGGGVQLFSLTAQIMPVAIVLHTIADCVPRALAFAERQGPERDLLVFGLYCGYVYTIRANQAPTLATAWNIGSLIGGIAHDTAKGILAVSDLSSRVHLYRLSARELVKTIGVTKCAVKRIQQVSLAEECTAIVVGGDRGTVSVYNRRSGELVSKMHLDREELVQTIAAAKIDGKPYIFAAKTREMLGRNDIFVFRKASGTNRLLLGAVVSLAVLAVVVILIAGTAVRYSRAVVIVGDWNLTAA